MFVSTFVSIFVPVLVAADAFPCFSCFSCYFFFLLFSLACTRALRRERVEKGERCVPGCQEVRRTLAALVAALVLYF